MTDIRKTTARCSSRKPHEIQPNLTIKVPAEQLAVLKGMASLRGVTVQEVVRGFIARGLGDCASPTSNSIGPTQAGGAPGDALRSVPSFRTSAAGLPI